MVKEALRAAQEDGIVFIDEIDKIVDTSKGAGGATSECKIRADMGSDGCNLLCCCMHVLSLVAAASTDCATLVPADPASNHAQVHGVPEAGTSAN